jgi:hypothetical protein
MMNKHKKTALTIIIGGGEEGEGMDYMSKSKPEMMTKSDMMDKKEMKCPHCGHDMEDMDEMEDEDEQMPENGMKSAGPKKSLASMLSMRALKSMTK